MRRTAASLHEILSFVFKFKKLISLTPIIQIALTERLKTPLMLRFWYLKLRFPLIIKPLNLNLAFEVEIKKAPLESKIFFYTYFVALTSLIPNMQ